MGTCWFDCVTCCMPTGVIGQYLLCQCCFWAVRGPIFLAVWSSPSIYWVFSFRTVNIIQLCRTSCQKCFENETTGRGLSCKMCPYLRSHQTANREKICHSRQNVWSATLKHKISVWKGSLEFPGRRTLKRTASLTKSRPANVRKDINYNSERSILIWSQSLHFFFVRLHWPRTRNDILNSATVVKCFVLMHDLWSYLEPSTMSNWWGKKRCVAGSWTPMFQDWRALKRSLKESVQKGIHSEKRYLRNECLLLLCSLLYGSTWQVWGGTCKANQHTLLTNWGCQRGRFHWHWWLTDTRKK